MRTRGRRESRECGCPSSRGRAVAIVVDRSRDHTFGSRSDGRRWLVRVLIVSWTEGNYCLAAQGGASAGSCCRSSAIIEASMRLRYASIFSSGDGSMGAAK